MPEPDLNDLFVFVQVVDSGSFTAAARHRGSPTSTISRRVARLERRLGSRLLHRTTRRLSLTDAGRRYYERGSRILEELEDSERELAELQASPRGRVRLAAPLEHSEMMPFISRFLASYPDVRIELFLTNRRVDLVEDGFDVAIQPGALPESSTVIAHKLMESQFWLVASPGYLLDRGEPESPKDLSGHDCILFGSSTDAVWTLKGDSGPSHTRVRGRIAVNHLLSARDAAAAGVGIAMLPSMVCNADIGVGALRIVLPESPPASVPVWITFQGGRHISPAVRAFVDFTKERFADSLEGLYGGI